MTLIGFCWNISFIHLSKYLLLQIFVIPHTWTPVTEFYVYTLKFSSVWWCSFSGTVCEQVEPDKAPSEQQCQNQSASFFYLKSYCGFSSLIFQSGLITILEATWKHGPAWKTNVTACTLFSTCYVGATARVLLPFAHSVHLFLRWFFVWRTANCLTSLLCVLPSQQHDTECSYRCMHRRGPKEFPSRHLLFPSLDLAEEQQTSPCTNNMALQEAKHIQEPGWKL